MNVTQRKMSSLLRILILVFFAIFLSFLQSALIYLYTICIFIWNFSSGLDLILFIVQFAKDILNMTIRFLWLLLKEQPIQTMYLRVSQLLQSILFLQSLSLQSATYQYKYTAQHLQTRLHPIYTQTYSQS